MVVVFFSFLVLFDRYAPQHQGKFLVCANLLGNKSVSDSVLKKTKKQKLKYEKKYIYKQTINMFSRKRTRYN